MKLFFVIICFVYLLEADARFDFAQIAKKSHPIEDVTESSNELVTDELLTNSSMAQFASCLNTLDTLEGKFLLEKKKNEFCVRNTDRWHIAVRNLKSALNNQTESLISCQNELNAKANPNLNLNPNNNLNTTKKLRETA